MTPSTFRISSLAVAAALTLGAASARAQSSTYPNGAQQPSYPQQQNTYPNAQQPNSYPNQQHNGYPNSNPNTYPNRDQRDHDDRDRDRMAERNVPHNWTTDQIITATVHQAWVLSGKDEANFFEIVRELAEMSARNRNMTLPDDPATGRRAGEYIKEQARADHDQLLYAIVDKSVQMTGRRGPTQGY
jgi:hypothetical protein